MNPLFGDGCITVLHLQLSDIVGIVGITGTGRIFVWGHSLENITPRASRQANRE